MLTSDEFRASPEWQKLETEILKMIAEKTDTCIQLAAEGKAICQYEAAFVQALAWVISLPDALDPEKKKTPDEPLKGIPISKLARKGTSLW